jgi:phage terminase small subunit
LELKEQARKLYAEGKSLKDIAVELGKPEGTIRSWKARYGWGKKSNERCNVAADATQRERQRRRNAQINRSIVERVEINEELSDTEKDFCLYYIQTFNATQAAWNTGQYATRLNAKTGGWQMLQKPAVQAEIKRLKEIKRAGILADVDDLIELHMRIAFADIKDFAVWGYEQATRSNRMAVLSSDTVDGQLVKEVSESAQGFKLKMQDKKSSLEFLERFFMANPMDKHKIEYDKAKLEMERKRNETHAPNTEDDDNLFEAIKTAVKKNEV